MAQYYVKTLEFIPHTPSSCMKCGRDELISGVIIAKTGPTTDNLSDKEAILCQTCETLMVVTDEEKKVVKLQGTPGNTVTFRSGRQ